MLRIRTMSASAAALLAGIGSAAAADVITYEPAPAPYSTAAATDWTGPYVGLTGGYGWGGGTVDHNGWIGGVYGGYNFQVNPSWVVGLEGDFTLTNKSGSTVPVSVNNPWNSTVRGRVGYAFDRYLLYGTGGVALGRVEAVTVGPVKEAATKVGWTAGVGLEAALTEVITGRIEFRHTDLGTHAFPVAPAIEALSNDLTIGVGVKF